jgi:ribulose-5-phosphate 4-epimerase/fuculose-1-phosphate aldolase
MRWSMRSPNVRASSKFRTATMRRLVHEPHICISRAGQSRIKDESGHAATAPGRKKDAEMGDIVLNGLNALIEELTIANRILAHEGVLDAFGHVSVRHPTDPNRYLLSRSRSPLLIEPDDILEYTLDSEPVRPPKVLLYAERVIHGCIYQARSDVVAVCHHHASAVMPFCIAGKPIVPVFHLGAAIGEDMPFWDQHDEFGDTNLLVVKPEEGRSLARALGQNSVVLMNRHGATVVGTSLKELVARSIFMCQNADYQLRALALGTPEHLHRGEIKLAGTLSRMPNVVSRTWEYWTMRLEVSGAMPPRRSAGKTARRTMPKSTRATARDRRKGRRR